MTNNKIKREHDMVIEALLDLISVDIERERQISELPIATQEELHDEWMYSNPNDFSEICELYSSFGLVYPYESWLISQAMFVRANKLTDQRLKKESEKNNEI
jgi:hypothetical protein